MFLLHSVIMLDASTDHSQPFVGDGFFNCPPNQFSMVGYLPNMVLTDNGKSRFESEGGD